MKKIVFYFFSGLLGLVFGGITSLVFAAEITPYKHRGSDNPPSYTVPHSSKFTIVRPDKAASPILYYATFIKEQTYPLALISQGSFSEGQTPVSVIHLHRSLLQEFLNLGIGVITVENWGVTDTHVDKKLFFHHYTRSQRVRDHQIVIDHLKRNPPKNWNGKFIFVGGSEGAYIARKLTEYNPRDALASMALVGTADGVWRDHLWAFMSEAQKTMPWYAKLAAKLPSFLRPKSLPPRTRSEYDQRMDETIRNPTPEKYFLGYTYKFQADALQIPTPDYTKIQTPFLVVSGVLDGNIAFSDLFVKKAQAAGVPITYLRIQDMGHSIMARPEVLAQAFDWLRERIAINSD